MATRYDDDVETALTRIMSQDSALMKQARTQGLHSAQAKGLGQSTMGIQAAQAAALNAAMPLASQQAQQGHQKNMQTSQFGHETGMQQAGFQHAASQSELDRAHATKQLFDSGYLDRLKMHEGAALERQTMGMQQAYESSQKDLDRAMQERLAAMEISAADRERLASSLAANEQSYAAQFAQVASNHELPANVRESYLQHMGMIRNSNFNTMSALYRSAGVVAW